MVADPTAARSATSVRMPGLDGIACLDRLSELDPPVAVIILTGLDERSVVLEAIRHGAAGYLLKSAPTDEIVATVTREAEGQLSIDPELLREALAAESRETARAIPVRHVELTARELDVLALLAEGMTNKEIGGGLTISEETVKKHVQNIIWRLGAADRTQAAIFALRRGLLAALGTGATGGPGSPDGAGRGRHGAECAGSSRRMRKAGPAPRRSAGVP